MFCGECFRVSAILPSIRMITPRQPDETDIIDAMEALLADASEPMSNPGAETVDDIRRDSIMMQLQDAGFLSRVKKGERERQRSYDLATPEMFATPVNATEGQVRQQMSDMLGEDAHHRDTETAQAFAEEAHFIAKEDAEMMARRRSEEEVAEPEDDEVAAD